MVSAFLIVGLVTAAVAGSANATKKVLWCWRRDHRAAGNSRGVATATVAVASDAALRHLLMFCILYPFGG